MRDTFYVYIITNKNNTTLYLGVTNDLERRMWEHKNGRNHGFSKKYKLTKLVYYEDFSQITDAIAREKQLKNWRRLWKENLINSKNQKWEDWSEKWDCFKDPETSSG